MPKVHAQPIAQAGQGEQGAEIEQAVAEGPGAGKLARLAAIRFDLCVDPPMLGSFKSFPGQILLASVQCQGNDLGIVPGAVIVRCLALLSDRACWSSTTPDTLSHQEIMPLRSSLVHDGRGLQ